MSRESDTYQRDSFASFLDRLGTTAVSGSDWETEVVIHYADEQLEGIHADLVRLLIKRDPLGHPVW